MRTYLDQLIKGEGRLHLYLLIGMILCGKVGAEGTDGVQVKPWEVHGSLVLSEDKQYLKHEDGVPFLWMGATAWGMTEWLSREDVDLYLDDRQSKGMDLVQFCLFWGKRVDYPTRFTVNPVNAYGAKAFVETNGKINPFEPAVVEGGSPEEPNDYWDHVEYCIQAMEDRGMYAAVLPVWGRRYVNATLSGSSQKIFTAESGKAYGKFLAQRFKKHKNIIWVLGGDVQATEGFDARPIYRAFAEGLGEGGTSGSPKWNEEAPEWDELLITYHPDGIADLNSSTWFQADPWLDFNMIETYQYRDEVATAIRSDLKASPKKPTILAEGSYEGTTNGVKSTAIHVRRQAYQSFFTGAAGFTYGAGFDDAGNGPLFSPSNHWKGLLEMEGAGQLIHLKRLLETHAWQTWEVADTVILEGKNSGELEKLAVKTPRGYLIYFPENSSCTLSELEVKTVYWFNPKSGEIEVGEPLDQPNVYQPPSGWEDGLLILQMYADFVQSEAFFRWQQKEFGAATRDDSSQEGNIWGRHANPDGDCFDNLTEYAFGLNPQEFDSKPRIIEAEGNAHRGEPVLRIGQRGEAVWSQFIFGRRLGYAYTGLSYQAELSSDLVAWEASEVEPVYLSDDGEIEMVEVDEPMALSNRFFRVFLNIN